MKRRFILLAVATFLSGTMMAAWDGSTKTAPSAGDGSEGSPYQIKTEENLAWLANTSSEWGKHFIQTADLDLGNHQWKPIGNSTTKFTGSYNGGEYVISNLYYNDNTQSNVGLFGYISNATLTHITIASGSVYGSGATGGICGYATNSTISYCANSSTIYGKKEQIGGVCGYLEKSTVTNCINYGLVSGFNFVGGVVGRCKSNNSNVITNCINVGQIFSMCATSGNIIGFNDNFTSTRENNYYDNQLNTLIGVTGYKNIIDPIADETGVAGLSTTNIIGKKLQDAFGSEATNWVFTEGLYPRINGSHNHSAIILAATPVTLESGDKADNVTTNFKVSTENGVSWESGESANLKISGKSATILKNTGVAIIASKDGFSKKIFLKTNKPNATHIGSETAPLTIETKKDLKDLREAVNTYGTYKHCAAYDGFKGIHFKVTVDIELSDWTEPIGIHNSFKGIFDGNHRSINNVAINQSSHSCVGGLFGCASYGEIKNLTVRGSVIGNELVGGICGASFAETLTNCHSYCELSCDGKKQIGGITGDDRGFTSFINCENHGTITGGQYSGGIIGRSHMGTIMDGCKNYGDITAKADNVGGICGSFAATAGGGSINNCENHGDIESTGKTKIGGIVGYIDDVKSNLVISINGCINSGNITSGKHTGGIIGHNKDTINISNCLNIGKLLNGTENIGGIVGLDAGCLTITNAFNASEIAGNGIIGTLNTISTCTNCINIGKATAANNCINDTKMCPTSSGKLTSEMLGTELQSSLGSDWTYTEGMYPMITALKESDYMKVAATPIILNETENATTVSKTLNYDSNSPVEWECSKANGVILVSFVNGKGYIANPETNTDVVLTAKVGDAQKNIPLTIKTKGILEEPQITWTLPDVYLKNGIYQINYGQPITADMLCATNSNSDWEGDEEYNVKVDSILHAGHHVLTVTFIPNNEEDGAYKTAFVELEVNKGDATDFITWEPATEITYGDEDSDSKLKNATAIVDGKFYYDIPALTVGTHSLKLEFIGTNYEATIELPDAVEVVAATPAIAWATPLAAIDYGTPLSALQLGAVSGVEGEFTYTAKKGDGDAEPVDIDAILDAGTYTLEATFTPNSGNYESRTATNELVVNKLKPVITWEPETAFAELNYGETLEENAFYASVPDEFNDYGSLSYFENDEAIDIRSILPAGTHTITAKFEPSNDNYDTNTAVATVKVNKLQPVITWETADEDLTFTYGAELSADKHLNATFSPADAIGEIVYTEGEDTIAAGDILNAGTHVLFATLAESDNFLAAVPVTKTITVNQIESEITWETPAPIAYGTPISEIELNATANTEGSFAYTLNGENAEGLKPEAGSYTIMVTFTPASANYTIANASVTLKITSVAAEITWETPEAITYGTPISAAQLNASANTEGEYIYSTHEGESVRYIHEGDVLGAGNDSLFVKFIPESEDYGRAVDTVILTVNKAELTVTVADTTVTQGDEMPVFKLAYSGFVNNENESALTTAPTATCAATTAEVGEFEIVVSGGESDNYNITCTNGKLIVVEATTPETPVITWAEPAAITYGTLISADILNATANVEGTFSYSAVKIEINELAFIPENAPTEPAYDTVYTTRNLAIGDTLNAGDYELIATFAPANGAEPITDTVKLTVAKATLTVSVADATVNQGDDMPSFSLDYKGFVLGETIADLTFIPRAKCDASTDNAGTFDIIVSGGASDNYNFEYKNGKLTVNAKETAIADSEVKISVYPNPTADVLFVETESNADYIYVYNMAGKLVLTEANVGKTRIDLTNEPQGTYFVKVGDKTIKVLKF